MTIKPALGKRLAGALKVEGEENLSNESTGKNKCQERTGLTKENQE